MVFIRREIRAAGGALPLREQLAVLFSPLGIAGSLQHKGSFVFPGRGFSPLGKIGFADVHLNCDCGGLLRVDHLLQADRAHAVIHPVGVLRILVQRLADAGAQIMLQLFLLSVGNGGDGDHRHQNEDGRPHPRRQGDQSVLNEPEGEEQAGIQDPTPEQQPEHLFLIGPHLLIYLKGLGLPVVEIAVDHAAAVGADRLLAVKLHLRPAGGAVDGSLVGVVVFLLPGAVCAADVSGLEQPAFFR